MKRARGIYTPSPKTSYYRVKFRRLRKNLWRFRTTTSETSDMCGDSAHSSLQTHSVETPCPETPETPDFSAETHFKDIPSDV
jgi:hypothetical protein